LELQLFLELLFQIAARDGLPMFIATCEIRKITYASFIC